MILSASGIGKCFGSRWLFRGIDLILEPGMALIITGRNGSGKSTLLKILAGLERPSEGLVTLGLREEQIERSYSALDQAVFPSLTVHEHLELAADLRGIPSHVGRVIDEVGLTEHADHQAQHLSSGLRSRLKIALAIQSEPKLLIWDEPGVALDDQGKDLVAKVIGEQLNRGALILATNDPEERRFGTHALEL